MLACSPDITFLTVRQVVTLVMLLSLFVFVAERRVRLKLYLLFFSQWSVNRTSFWMTLRQPNRRPCGQTRHSQSDWGRGMLGKQGFVKHSKHLCQNCIEGLKQSETSLHSDTCWPTWVSPHVDSAMQWTDAEKPCTISNPLIIPACQ